MMWCLLLATVKGQAPANFSYASGRLFQDPETTSEINSPYLAFSKNGKQVWIVYDPLVKEGRFVSVTSSFTGGIACGYVKGQFSFLGKTVNPPSGQYTGVIASVDQGQNLQWLYTHSSILPHSTFTSTVKRADGYAIVSGYEYSDDDQTALLICFDREGTKVWERTIPDARGYHLLIDKEEKLTWVVLDEHKKSFRSVIHDVDPYSGESLITIEETGQIDPFGIRGSTSLCKAGNGSIVSARLTDGISLNKYDKEGQHIWRSNLSIGSEFEDAVELTGVVVRPNRNIQVSLNLMASITLLDEVAIHPSGEGEVLLITLDSKGKYIGHELYGGTLAKVNGIFKSGNQVGIVGCHKSNLWIQDSLLVSKSELEESYLVYLKDYEAARLVVKTDTDSTALEHLGGLTLFPNPVSNGMLSVVDEKINPEESHTIDIYDTSGRLRLSTVTTPKSGSMQYEIDVSGFSSGLYHVFLSQNDQPVSSGRFIIQQ